MFAKLARLLLEANGARPAATPRPIGQDEIVATADGFVSRPRPPRVTRWCEYHHDLEQVDAVWDPVTQAFVDPVHGPCTEPVASGDVGSRPVWSPAEEARQFTQQTDRKPRDRA